MTTIIAAHDPVHDQIIVAADKRTTVNDRPIDSAEKIISWKCDIQFNDEDSPEKQLIVLACTGDGAAPMLLAHSLNSAERSSINATDWTTLDWDLWATQLAREITNIYLNHGLTYNDTQRMGGQLLLACHNRLWTILHNQAIRNPDGHEALGSGGDFAQGAYEARRSDFARSEDPDVHDWLIRSVKTAGKFDPYTGGGITTAATRTRHLD